MEELWVDVLGKLGGTAALVLLVVAATWKAFQYISAKWLDARFTERLKLVEQQHDVMVRQLQSAIDREFDRAVRLHAREFTALSKGWKVLHEAYWRTRASTGRGHQIVDFTQMSAAQATHFLATSDLAAWQRLELEAIATPEGRNEYYTKVWWWQQYGESERARLRLIQFVDRNAIFLQPDIRQTFDRLHELINNALIELKIRIQGSRYDGDFERSDQLRDAEGPLYQDLERRIHARIWSPTIAELRSGAKRCASEVS